MKLRHWITGVVLLLLVALAVGGFLRTRESKPAGASQDAGKAPAKTIGARNPSAALHPLVDQRPLQTARRDGALAYTEEEKDLARQSQKDNLQDQLGVAQAQLELDQDERDDAAEALEQAGGDPQSEVQRQKQQHDDEEAYLSTHAMAGPDPVEGNYQAHTLLAVFRAWKALREKKAKLEEALQESVAA